MAINIDNIQRVQFDYDESEGFTHDVEVVSAVWATTGKPLNQDELNELNTEHEDFVLGAFLMEAYH